MMILDEFDSLEPHTIQRAAFHADLYEGINAVLDPFDQYKDVFVGEELELRPVFRRHGLELKSWSTDGKHRGQYETDAADKETGVRVIVSFVATNNGESA